MSPIRIFLKATVLVVLTSLLFVFVSPASLGRITLYNHVFPGRERLPFGEDQRHAYNLSLYNVEAMIASHTADASAAEDGTFRVFLLGDSSVWGTLLMPEQTLAGALNAQDLTLCGKPAHFYNFGYPTLSLTKDLLFLGEVMGYEPDEIVWLMTLESFPREDQLATPLLANNPRRARDLIARFHLRLDPKDPGLVESTLLNRTLVGQRRDLADLIRLQLYGVMWAATGVDQVYPEDYEAAQTDLAADPTFHGRTPPSLDPDSLSLDVLEAGIESAGGTPLLLVNEPILRSTGTNSGIRYNFFYPRWAYDQYRMILAEHAEENGWRYLDLWDIIPPGEFTNTAIHLNPAAEQTLAQAIASELNRTPCP
jgi:hypothetical protein